MFYGDASEWSESVFGQAELGDKRRTARLVRLASVMAESPSLAVDAACGDDCAEAEGAHRFVRNGNVSASAVFEAGAKSTAEIAVGIPGDLLALEDSTTLSYPHSTAKKLGDTGGKKGTKKGKGGWWVHSVILASASNHIPIGPIYQKRWCRRPEQRGKKHQRRSRAYEQKESFKWEEASREVDRRLGPENLSRVISVCDREADVFEYLDYKLSNGQRFVLRASHNRNVCTTKQGEKSHLWDVMKASAVRKRFCVTVPQKGGRKERIAKLSMRFRKVTLAMPNFRRSTVETPLELGVVFVTEDNPVDKVEPLEWMLLTSEPIGTPKQAMRVLEHYRTRWLIEDWHKAWKTGCAVEKRRQQDTANLEKVVVITEFIAIRLLQLRALANAHADESCEECLTDTEWKCLWLSVEKTALPKRSPNIRWAYRSIGRLGGWKDSKRDGKVGWQLLYRGWVKLQERAEGYRLAASQLAPGEVTK